MGNKEKSLMIPEYLCTWRYTLIYNSKSSTAVGMIEGIELMTCPKECHKCFGYDTDCPSYTGSFEKAKYLKKIKGLLSKV